MNDNPWAGLKGMEAIDEVMGLPERLDRTLEGAWFYPGGCDIENDAATAILNQYAMGWLDKQCRNVRITRYSTRHWSIEVFMHHVGPSHSPYWDQRGSGDTLAEALIQAVLHEKATE